MRTAPSSPPEPGGIDLVLPVFNEELALPAVLASLAAQVDGSGRPLPRGSFRVIAVDNGSTDASRRLLARAAATPTGPRIELLDEAAKGVVQARIRGSRFALGDRRGRRFPWIVHGDADNRFPPGFIHDVWRRLSAGGVDAVTYMGYPPTGFWRRLPTLAAREHHEVGALGFSPRTLTELGLDGRALFTTRVFDDFELVPGQCGLAMSKLAFERAGGYRLEHDADGRVRLGEGLSLVFRLDRSGARLGWAGSPWIEVNPRRMLLEPGKAWAGRSYLGGMSDPRRPPAAADYAALDRRAAALDFAARRRALVRRHVLIPCIARPSRLRRNRGYFGDALPAIERKIERIHAERRADELDDVLRLAEELARRHAPTIVANMRQMRGLD